MTALPAIVLVGLETAINRYLRLDPAALARLAPLAGKVIAVELRGLDRTLYMVPHAGGVHLLHDYLGTPDTIISGAPFSLLRLGLDKEGGRGPLLEGTVDVRGDMDAGQRFEAVLRDIDIDWEEQLSRLVGDVAAHQVGVVLRGVRDWGRRGADHLRRDVGDYLQEESTHLPRREEVDEFTAAVDRLRGDADRLAARVRRLQNWQTQREES